jgi:hypothetical protein
MRLGRTGLLALTAALVAGSAGCSYLKWRKERSEGLAELKKEPNLVLEEEVLPENCFVLVGGPEYDELFFGWGLHGHHGPTPAGDGTITLANQLHTRAQTVATGMSGYEQTHVGILSDKTALEELSRILDEACEGEGARK